MRILRGVSSDIAAGEVVGLVGESGCGKPMTAMALLGLLARTSLGAPCAARSCSKASICCAYAPAQLRRIVGNRIAMIFQEPMSALDPVFTIGEQISGVVRAHRPISHAAARAPKGMDERQSPGRSPRGRW